MTDWADEARETCDHDHSTVGCWTCPNPGLVPCVQCAKIAAALREAEERGRRSERDLLEKLFKAAVLDDYNDAHLAIVQALREAEESGAERARQEERWACHESIAKLYARWKRERGYPLDFGRAATLAAISARGPMLAPEEE